jgi:hypothetical protein
MPAIEEIILRHSRRGMPALARELPPDACRAAARALLLCDRGVVLLCTGFHVGAGPETDGPPGTWFLGRGLERLGFQPVIVTDAPCAGFFAGLETRTVPPEPEAGQRACRELLVELRPQALIAVERCGRDERGRYRRMNGADITVVTAPLDELFLQAPAGTLTIGIGDGGNEIGMGRLREVIERELAITPTTVATEHLLVATVSNWGAYGLLAALGHLGGLFLLPSAGELAAYLQLILDRGAVAVPSGRPLPVIDGFELAVEQDIVAALGATEPDEPHQIIKVMQVPHCARGPSRCQACRDAPREIRTLTLRPLDGITEASPTIEIETATGPRWFTF